MSELNPKLASELARDVYLVQTKNQVGSFLTHEVFADAAKENKASRTHLVAEVGGRIILNFKDGFGICALGGGVYSRDLFLVFRGTTTANKKADVLTDARIGIKNSNTGLPVHCGFDHCFSSMLPQIKSFFAGQNANKIETVHCVGHSLGGAVAALAADWVAANKAAKVKLYTFGAPRVGTAPFAMQTTSRLGLNNMHRVYHRTDPVPMVPLFPFMQAPYDSDGHYLPSDHPLTSGEAHFMKNYVKSVKEKTWRQMNTVPDRPCTLETSIAIWLKSKSPVNPSDHKFWHWLESALIFVLKKIAMGAILTLQAGFITGFTFADKLAYILRKGIDLAENVSIWVELLIRKMMQALGMKVAKAKEELTRSLIRYVLLQLAEKAQREARNAIRKLNL